MIRFNPVPGTTDIAFQLRVSQILQRVNAAYQPVIFKYRLPCRIGRCVCTQFADQRSLRHFFQPQRGDDAIEVAFFADDKVQVYLSGRQNQAIFICRWVSGAVQLLQLLVQISKMRFKAKAKPVKAREIADALQARGVKLALGTSIYDPADPMGKMFFNVLATFAEFEGDLIRLRTREGMAIARAKGKLRGKQPKLSDKQQKELCRMHGSGEYSISDLAELFSVSRPTVYRTLSRGK